MNWDPRQHPRDTIGRFMEVLGELGHAEHVDLPGGIRVRAHGGVLRVRKPKKRLYVGTDEHSAARSALDASAQSTHPESLGGKQSFTSARAYFEKRGMSGGARPEPSGKTKPEPISPGGKGVRGGKSPGQQAEDLLKRLKERPDLTPAQKTKIARLEQLASGRQISGTAPPSGQRKGTTYKIGTKLSTGAAEKLNMVTRFARQHEDHPALPPIGMGDVNDVRRNVWKQRGRGKRIRGEFYSGNHPLDPNPQILLQPDSGLEVAAHEYGHFLDYQLAGSVTRGASQSATSPAYPVMKAILDSPEYAMLSDSANRTNNRRYANYLLKEQELFARAYAQWVVEGMTDSGKFEGAPLSRARRQIDEDSGDFMSFPKQWTAENFKPIADAFDFMFAHLAEKEDGHARAA